MGVEYREEPCRSALNRVQGMGFNWSLNPYMGCVHRCTYCYVRAYELRALRALVDGGVDAGVGIAPVLPGITDKPELLADVARAARDAGATGLWCNVLFLRPGTREHFLESLARHWPEQLARYERLYTRPYLTAAETEPIKKRVAALRARLGIADRRRVKLEPPPAPEQLSLVT